MEAYLGGFGGMYKSLGDAGQIRSGRLGGRRRDLGQGVVACLERVERRLVGPRLLRHFGQHAS